MSLVVGVRGFTAAGFVWDVSGSVGAHETDLFISDTVNASLGPDTPTAFDLGSNRQRVERTIHDESPSRVSDPGSREVCSLVVAHAFHPRHATGRAAALLVFLLRQLRD